MFGTSGIRGIANQEVTPELLYRVGLAFAENHRQIVLARDTRRTGEMLGLAFSAGVMAAGAKIIDIGIAPTPVLAFATRERKCGGAMITASHNPPEYNGIKLFELGGELSRKKEREIESKVRSGKFRLASWDKCGGCETSSGEISAYGKMVLGLVNVRRIRRKKPRVVIDPGNGAAGALTPALLKQAGCEVICVNCETDGIFRRKLEPNAENLRETAALVKAKAADLGIAHDGDADRAMAIDETGELVGLDQQLALVCIEELERTGKKETAKLASGKKEKLGGKGKAKIGVAGGEERPKIVSTVEASLAVREAVEKQGGELLITKVSSLDVAQEVRRHKAVFGGEPCGEYVFPEGLLAADGVLAALKLVELCCKKGSLHKLKQGIKRYPMERLKFPCAEAKKKRAMEKIRAGLEKLGRKGGLRGKMSEIDGLRLDWETGWLLVRPSGTEPCIRLTLEEKSAGKLKEKTEELSKVITSNL